MSRLLVVREITHPTACFTYTDGSIGKVATATLMADAQGYRVEQTVSVDGSGTRTVETTAYAASGDVAYALTSVTTADGSSITNTWDFNGDKVVWVEAA